jgi:hypothetical protein
MSIALPEVIISSVLWIILNFPSIQRYEANSRNFEENPAVAPRP